MRTATLHASDYRDYRYARSKAMLRRRARRLQRIRATVILLVVVFLTALITLRLSANRADAVSVPTYKYYTTIEVNQGESLWTVASENMTEGYDDIYELMGEIVDINHLSGETLDVGQKLVIPYYSTEYKN